MARGVPRVSAIRGAIGRHPILAILAASLGGAKAGEKIGEKYRSYRDPKHKRDIKSARGRHKKRKFSIKGNAKDPRLVRVDKRAANYMVLNNEKQLAAMSYSERKRARKGKKSSAQRTKNLRAYKAFIGHQNKGALERISKY